MALAFLHFEELPKEEQPPKEIWFNSEKMSEHWKAVEQRRKEKYGGGQDDGGDGDMRRNAALDDLYQK